MALTVIKNCQTYNIMNTLVTFVFLANNNMENDINLHNKNTLQSQFSVTNIKLLQLPYTYTCLPHSTISQMEESTDTQ